MTGVENPRAKRSERPGRATLLSLIAGGVVVVIGLVVLLLPRDASPPVEPTPTATSDAFDVPEGWETFRPTFHLTPEQHWMNDPQRPVLIDGEWHLYELVVPNAPPGSHVMVEALRDGLSRGAVDAVTPTVTTRSVAYFGHFPQIALERVRADVAEVLVLARTPTLDDRQAVEAYLTARWGPF